MLIPGMPPLPSQPDIEVHIPFSLSLARGILEGVNRFRAEHPGLAVAIHDYGGKQPLRHCRAVIGFSPRLFREDLGKEVRAAVNLSNHYNPPPTHSVLNDDSEVGLIAADHLVDLGFRSFAFARLDGVHFSNLRFQGFRDRLRERMGAPGLEVPNLDQADRDAILASLPTPCGLLAANDHAAARTVETALAAGLRVPEDLAVLGVDDDPIRCAMSPVELSSVRLNNVAHGYEAMVLIQELLKSGRAPHKRIIRLIPPLGVSTRRSTDTFAHPHPGVVAALRAVRDQIRELRGVQDLARACGLGTRSLERLFREHLQTSPKEALTQSRFRFARNLLIESNLTINEVAERAGYGDVRTLIWQCRRNAGMTPLALRKRFRV